MIEAITLHAFDEIVNPVMLCELDGRVFYKNPEAVKKLRLPGKGDNLTAYLIHESKELFAPAAKAESFPTFLEIESNGDYFCVFADVAEYERRPVLLLVYSHLFLYELSVPLFTASSASLRELFSGEELAKLATDVYTSDMMVEAGRKRAFHRKMTQVYYKLIDKMITELAYGKESLYYPLAYAVQIVDYACEQVLSRLGLDIVFDMRYEEADMMLIDFKPFVLLVANFILYAAEISDGHIINATVERDEEDDVIFSFLATVQNPVSRIPMGGVSGFSELLPGRSTDLYFFDKALSNGKYRFDFTLNQKINRNLCLCLHAPIYRRYHVYQRDAFRVADALRLIDEFVKENLPEAPAED